MKQVGIIGYGRFGKILFDMLKSKYHVKVYDSNHTQSNDVEIVSLEEILKLEIIFIAIPISSFEKIIKLISEYKLHIPSQVIFRGLFQRRPQAFWLPVLLRAQS